MTASRRLRLAVPNGLSLSRLLLAGLFPAASFGQRIALLALAPATDILDGWLARRLDARTWYGGFLDASTDKVFALTVLVTALQEERLAPWQLGALLVRDFVVIGLTLGLVLRRARAHLRRMARHRGLGKIATDTIFLYFLALFCLPEVGPLIEGLFVIATLFNAVSALDYLIVRGPLLWRPEPVEETS